MLKNILNLKNAQELSKNEQLSINGGGPTYQCDGREDCPAGGCWYCINNRCKDLCW